MTHLTANMTAALLAAALSGAAMAFQGAFNAALSKRLGLVGMNASVHAIGTIIVGLGATVIFFAARHWLPRAADAAAAPGYAYLGGLLSVLIVAGVAFAFPVTGPGLGVSVIVTAQLAAALVLDHFGLFETTPHPVTWLRLAGVALLILGTRLVAE